MTIKTLDCNLEFYNTHFREMKVHSSNKNSIDPDSMAMIKIEDLKSLTF